MPSQPDEVRRSRLQEDAKLLCWQVAEDLVIKTLGEDLSGLGAKTATMNLIKEGRMMLVITGPSFEPELISVNEDLQALLGFGSQRNMSLKE